MAEFIALGIVAFIVLWIIFVNVMWAKHNPDKIPKIFHLPIKIIAFFGLLYDILFNWVFGTVMFLELPREMTLTERMKRILISKQDWRFYLALWICHNLVEPWDPNHCGLRDIPLRVK